MRQKYPNYLHYITLKGLKKRIKKEEGLKRRGKYIRRGMEIDGKEMRDDRK